MKFVIENYYMENVHKTIAVTVPVTFIPVYSLFKSERLSANIKLTLYKILIRSIMSYPRLRVRGRHSF